ncbi:MAG TPA: O-antigen ligase family protein [Opitutaceae bacterium]|jgi:O-antigen ligase|nr:O-antigen ligase family protein [Opitutaceae bacterium]
MTLSSTAARPSAWEWARAGVLSANIAWTTLCLGGFLPGTRVAMIVMTALLVALHFCDPDSAPRAHPAGWLLVPFLAYGVWNLEAVSQVRWIGWTDWLGWAQAIAVFWVVLNGVRSPGARRLVCLAIVGVAVVSVGMAAYQHFVNPKWLMLGRTQVMQYSGRATGSFGIPNSLGVFMALLIPPVAFTVFDRASPALRRVLAALVLATLVYGFVLAVSRAAWLALAAALALRSLFAPGRSIGLRVLGAVAAIAIPAATVAVLYYTMPVMHERVLNFVKDSGEHSRPIIWRGAWGIFLDHPVFGGGAGCFDVLFEKFRPIGFRDDPVYAHCDYLNTLCDYGAVGFVLLFGAVAAIAWKCRGARGIDGAVLTGLLAFSLHLLVDFHMKIPAIAIVVATLGAFMTGSTWIAKESAGHGAAARATGIALALIAMAFGIFWAAPRFRAEEIRRAAREKIDKMAEAGKDVSHEHDAFAGIRTSFERAVALDPRNAQAWSDKAYADTLWGLIEPLEIHALGIQAEKDAVVAIQLSPVVAEFWVRKGAGLDMQGKWLKGGECNATALQIAPCRADTWYYQAYHSSLDPIEKGPALAAADLSLRLDPGFRLAQSLRQRLAP